MFAFEHCNKSNVTCRLLCCMFGCITRGEMHNFSNVMDQLSCNWKRETMQLAIDDGKASEAGANKWEFAWRCVASRRHLICDQIAPDCPPWIKDVKGTDNCSQVQRSQSATITFRKFLLYKFKEDYHNQYLHNYIKSFTLLFKKEKGKFSLISVCCCLVMKP